MPSLDELLDIADAPQTGPEAISYALQNIDMEQVKKKAYDDIHTGKRPRGMKLLPCSA